MTCARRLAGARNPASPSESPRRPDPRSGRRRARLSLLPALALLLGALGLFAAAPAWAQVPAAPTDLAITPGDAKLDLTWMAPGGTVTGYDVHYTASQSVDNDAAVGTTVATEWVDAGHSGTTASQTISSLTNATAYRARVRAKNSEGSGPWAFATTTPQATATLVVQWARSSVTVRETDADQTVDLDVLLSKALSASLITISVSITGTATGPGSDPGDDWRHTSVGCINVFQGDTSAVCRIIVVGDDTAESAETLELTIASVTTGTATIGPRNVLTVTIEDDDSPPAAPTNLDVTAGDTKLDLSWRAPSGPVTGYDVHYTASQSAGDDDAVGTDWVDAGHTGTTASDEITGLNNDTPYRVRVRAVNTNGSSAWLHGTGTPEAPTAPSVPRNVQATPGDGKITLTWQAPSSWGTWTAIGYSIGWKLSSAPDASWSVITALGPGFTSREFTGVVAGATVTNGTAYDLRIRARSRQPGADGTEDSHHLQSAWVTVSNQVPVSPMALEMNLRVTPGDRRLTLRWTAPDVPGSTAISGYDVQYREARCIKQKRRADNSPVFAGDVPVYVDCDENNPNQPGHWIAHGAWSHASDPIARQTSRVIDGLIPGSAYDVRVRVHTARGGRNPADRGRDISEWVTATGTLSGGSARLRQLDLRQ